MESAEPPAYETPCPLANETGFPLGVSDNKEGNEKGVFPVRNDRNSRPAIRLPMGFNMVLYFEMAVSISPNTP